MINATMRNYDYYTYGGLDEYGQPHLSNKKGSIKMSINLTSQTVQDNILYKDATYVGLTHANVTDAFVIQYGDERLKVLYVNPMGRLKQVFLKTMA